MKGGGKREKNGLLNSREERERHRQPLLPVLCVCVLTLLDCLFPFRGRSLCSFETKDDEEGVRIPSNQIFFSRIPRDSCSRLVIFSVALSKIHKRTGEVMRLLVKKNYLHMLLLCKTSAAFSSRFPFSYCCVCILSERMSSHVSSMIFSLMLYSCCAHFVRWRLLFHLLLWFSWTSFLVDVLTMFLLCQVYSV